MKVAIVLLNWNTWRDVLECLESVFKLTYPNFRVILCDNNSADGTLEHVQAWAKGELPADLPVAPLSHLGTPPLPKPIEYALYERTQAEVGGKLTEHAPLVMIQTGANLGYAGGNNVGLRYVLARQEFEYIWLLNVDTVVDPEALSKLVEVSESDKYIGMTGSTLLYYDAPHEIQTLAGGIYNPWLATSRHIATGKVYTSGQYTALVHQQLTYIMGASLLARVELLREIGLMEERYFLFFEEVDWAVRVKGRYRLAYAPDSLVYHREGRSSGASTQAKTRSLKAEFYGFRNRLRLTAKCYPYALPTVWLGLGLTALRRLWQRQLPQARLALEVMFGRQEFS